MSNNLSFPSFSSVVIFAPDSFLLSGDFCTWENLSKKLSSIAYGISGDIPLPGDYNGDGTEQMAIFRPCSNQWLIKGMTSYAFGDTNTYYSIPLRGDYDGNGTSDIAVYNPAEGLWWIKGQTKISFGTYIDFPLFD